MINKNKILKAAKEIFHSNRSNFNQQLIHPQREWLIGILCSFVIFGVSGFISAKWYKENRSIQISRSVDTQTEQVVYRESLVAAALERFSVRKKELEFLTEKKETSIIPVIENTITSSTTATTSVSTDAGVIVETGIESTSTPRTSSTSQEIKRESVPNESPVLAN